MWSPLILQYLSAIDEAEYVIAQASAPGDNKGRFTTDLVDVRNRNEFTKTAAENVDLWTYHQTGGVGRGII